MPRFSVMVGFHTSQVIEVEADTLDQALEHAIGDTDLPNASNEFELEWPRGSGRIRRFPEVDRAQWFDLATARVKVLSGQLPIIEALADKMQAEGIPTEDYDDMDEDEIWKIRDRINQLADEI